MSRSRPYLFNICSEMVVLPDTCNPCLEVPRSRHAVLMALIVAASSVRVGTLQWLTTP